MYNIITVRTFEKKREGKAYIEWKKRRLRMEREGGKKRRGKKGRKDEPLHRGKEDNLKKSRSALSC